MRFDTRTIVGAVALGVAVIGFAYLGAKPEPIPVDPVEVSFGMLEVTVDVQGETRVRDIYELSAPVFGNLERSPVSVGDVVVANETIVARIAPGTPAFLDDRARAQANAAVSQAQAAVHAANAQTAMAEAELGNAQLALNRLHDLHERGTIPQATLEGAELALDVAAAQLDSAHAAQDMRLAELAAQEASLIDPSQTSASGDSACCVEIHAPVSGTVLAVTEESARAVQTGAPILSIGQDGPLEIIADVLSTDAVRLREGALAYVERWGGAGTLQATLKVIEPAGFTKTSALGIEEQRVRVVLELAMPSDTPQALGHAFRTYLRIVEWQGEVKQVPLSALFRNGSDWAVFVIKDDRAVLTPVQIGQKDNSSAQLLTDLEVGSRLIAHPSDRIADGVLIVDRNAL